jgi:outer membrane protein OmpA-like peptidoglycan-associated protein
MNRIQPIILCLIVGAQTATAADDPPKAERQPGEVLSMGLGAVAGGLIAGPPGAILGAGSGAFMADRKLKREQRITELEYDNRAYAEALAAARAEIDRLNVACVDSMLKAAATPVASTAPASFAMDVFFRTDSEQLEPAAVEALRPLVRLLDQFPDLKVRIDGYADQRGADQHNEALSQRRARSVRMHLENAGIDPSRLIARAYGERMANAEEQDLDGLAFDRRVRVTLSLDTEA